MSYPGHTDSVTVSDMTSYHGPRGTSVEVEDDGTADLHVAEDRLEPEELRMLAKACTQAAQHIEAARR